MLSIVGGSEGAEPWAFLLENRQKSWMRLSACSFVVQITVHMVAMMKDSCTKRLPKKIGPRLLCKVTHCTGHFLVNIGPAAGVTGRWGLPSHAQDAVRWLALSKRLVDALQRHCLFLQLSFMQLSFYEYTWSEHISDGISKNAYDGSEYCEQFSHHGCNIASFPGLPCLQFLIVAVEDTASNLKLDGGKAWGWG